MVGAAGLLVGVDQIREGPAGAAGLPGKSPLDAPGAQHAGTVTWAEFPGGGPTWILPIVMSAASSSSNITQFQFLMWRPLYWFGNGAEASRDAGDEPGLRPEVV